MSAQFKPLFFFFFFFFFLPVNIPGLSWMNSMQDFSAGHLFARLALPTIKSMGSMYVDSATYRYYLLLIVGAIISTTKGARRINVRNTEYGV